MEISLLLSNWRERIKKNGESLEGKNEEKITAGQVCISLSLCELHKSDSKEWMTQKSAGDHIVIVSSCELWRLNFSEFWILLTEGI